MTIKANELRIGNYVSGASRGNPCVVTSGIIECIENKQCIYNPIEITEEWIKRAGMEPLFIIKDPERWRSVHRHRLLPEGMDVIHWWNPKHHQTISRYIEYIERRYVYATDRYMILVDGMTNDEVEILARKTNPIKYIHQWQNWQFCLNGKEIKFKF